MTIEQKTAETLAAARLGYWCSYLYHQQEGFLEGVTFKHPRYSDLAYTVFFSGSATQQERDRDLKALCEDNEAARLEVLARAERGEPIVSASWVYHAPRGCWQYKKG